MRFDVPLSVCDALVQRQLASMIYCHSASIKGTVFGAIDQFSSSWLGDLSALRALKVRFYKYEASPLALTITAPLLLQKSFASEGKDFFFADSMKCYIILQHDKRMNKLHRVVKDWRGPRTWAM